MGTVDDEQSWVLQSRQGDHAAFEHLVRAYQPMVHALAYRMTGSSDAAEDLAQEAFVQAFHQIASFRNQSRFSTWLCRIAINISLNWRQREGRRSDVHRVWASQVSISAPPAQSASVQDELGQLVREALDRLPPKQRAAIVLTVYEELNHGEAARVLNCSEATVSWRVFAARRKLRRWLKSLSSLP
jgi:RNA polymerase sigma-70 factor, ECF subfamily